MKLNPEQIRNAAWGEIQAELNERRAAVWAQLRAAGPSTTRELAQVMGQDKDCVAPRVTELFQLGFVRLAGKRGKRGLYQAVSLEDARRDWESRRLAATPRQLDLRMQA